MEVFSGLNSVTFGTQRSLLSSDVWGNVTELPLSLTRLRQQLQRLQELTVSSCCLCTPIYYRQLKDPFQIRPFVSEDCFYPDRVHAVLNLEAGHGVYSWAALSFDSLTDTYAEEQCRKAVNKYVDEHYPLSYRSVMYEARLSERSYSPWLYRKSYDFHLFDPFPARPFPRTFADYFYPYDYVGMTMMLPEPVQPSEPAPHQQHKGTHPRASQASSHKGGGTAAIRKPTALPMRN